MDKVSIEISPANFLEIIGLIIFLFLLFMIRDILLLLFFAVILTSALNPLVDRLEKHGLARWLAILSLYFVIIFVLVLVLSLVIPPLITETDAFIKNLPQFTEQALREIGLKKTVTPLEARQFIQNLITQILPQDSLVVPSLLRFGVGVFSGLFSILSIFVFTFYLLLEHKKIKRGLIFLIRRRNHEETLLLINQVEKKLGSWLRGQTFLMALVATFDFIGLAFLRIDFALPLAIMGGFLEIVPIIGPILSAVPAIIVAAAISPLKALSVALLFLLVQQIENNVFVPKIMRDAVGLDPILILLGLMVGVRLLGPWGALLSVPVLAVILILLSDLLKERQGS